MSYTYNFEDESIQTFDHLKGALKERFDDLFSKGYLYKGDMGETPQIVNRPLAKFNDGKFENWTALGKSIIGEIFKDIEKYKSYYNEDGKVNNINDLISKLTTDGKLNGLTSATYSWWCADGNSKYPIYPATYFVYIDSTPNDIRNKDKDWEDNSCILIPANVKYSEDATAEEQEPEVTYHKNHIYPTFYFDANAREGGAWCWKINDVETGIPASIANDDGTSLGRMFLFKKEGNKYLYKVGLQSDENEGWMSREQLIEKRLRCPINGDIGFTAGESTASEDNKSLQIYSFVGDKNDVINGGEWSLGGDLVTFDENFYTALWTYISEYSKTKIGKNKIIMETTSGSHCIFVKNDDKTMVLMPFRLGADTDPSNFNEDNSDRWQGAELSLNYPKTTIGGNVIINDGLTVETLAVGESMSAPEITTGEITTTRIIGSKTKSHPDSVIIGSTESNKIQIHADELTTDVRKGLSAIYPHYMKFNNEILIHPGMKNTVIDIEDNNPLCRVTATYESGKFSLLTRDQSEIYVKEILLKMPYSLGITVNIMANNGDHLPILENGSIEIELMAVNSSKGTEFIGKHSATIGKNNQIGSTESGSGSQISKFCTMYCSIPVDKLEDWSSIINKNRENYTSIYFKATAIFNLGGSDNPIYSVNRNAWYVTAKSLNTLGGSEWKDDLSNIGLAVDDILSVDYIEYSARIQSFNNNEAHICSDGIVIGKYQDLSTVIYNDILGGLHIDYYYPEGKKNVLSIDSSGVCTSGVFELKTTS